MRFCTTSSPSFNRERAPAYSTPVFEIGLEDVTRVVGSWPADDPIELSQEIERELSFSKECLQMRICNQKTRKGTI